MSDKGEMRTGLNDLDHILPEVAFLSVETLRDPTFEGFLYVLGNLLRTHRYGSGQESRTGTMTNHIVGLAFCDGEIFSNLHFTQALYDTLNAKGDIHVPIQELLQEAAMMAEACLKQEPVRSTAIWGAELEQLLKEVTDMYQNEVKLRATMTTLCQQTQTYAESYGALFPEKQKEEKRKAKQSSSL